jgi:hypothetical protein
MMRWLPWIVWAVLIALIILIVAGCAIGTTNDDPVPSREGGINAMVCMMFSICNFQGSTGQSKDQGSTDTKQDAKQDGSIEAKPKEPTK